MNVLPRWRLACATALLCSIPLLGTAHAKSRARVVVVTTDRDSATAKRVEAELHALDVEVVTVVANGGDLSIRKGLERVASEQGAFAAVRIVPSGNEAEVWVADRVTGKTLVREVISGKDAGAFDDAVSLGAVELLRASLLEVATVTELKGDVAPPEEVKRLLPPSKPVPAPSSTTPAAPGSWSPVKAPFAFATFTMGPSIDLGVAQLGTGSSAELDLKIVNTKGWGGELLSRAPLFGQETNRREGNARIHSQQLYAMGCYAPTINHLAPSFALGIAAASITSNGQAALPMLTQEEQRLRLLAVARFGLGWRILPSLGLRLDGTLGYAATPLKIRIAGNGVAQYGRPMFALSAGAEVRLPL